MKINLDQRTDEWHEFRRFRIGASDAPVIMGMSPYKTPLQLYNEKMNDEVRNQTSSMRFGIENEPMILQHCIDLLDIPLSPATLVSDTDKWAMASLDGYNEEKKVFIEIKTANEEDHRTALEGNVPEKYVHQLQHQFFVADSMGDHEGYYASYHKGDVCVFQVFRDEKIISKMIGKIKEFYDRMVSLDPPEPTEKDVIPITEYELVCLAHEYLSKKKQVEDLNLWLDQAKTRLIGERKSGSYSCGPLKLMHISRKGNIQYGKIPELQSVDLEQYRSDEVISWRFSES